jgi:hypothetical protein
VVATMPLTLISPLAVSSIIITVIAPISVISAIIVLANLSEAGGPGKVLPNIVEGLRLAVLLVATGIL